MSAGAAAIEAQVRQLEALRAAATDTATAMAIDERLRMLGARRDAA